MALLAGSASVYSQSYISMNDYGYFQSGSLPTAAVQVFPTQPLGNSPVLVTVNGYAGYEEMGNPANSYLRVPGTTVYATGQSTIGPGYEVGLLAIDGIAATSYAQLQVVPNVAINQWWNNEAMDPVDNNYGVWRTTFVATIPGNSTMASIAVAVWQDMGPHGAASTLAQAQADGYEWGVSGIVTASVATGNEVPTWLPTSLTSFSLVAQIPEPSTVALGILGASALFLRRRKA